MRHFDFAPLYRSTIGFDRMAQLLDNLGAAEEATYPPYNIERLAENEYRITMAVAGFAEGDLKIEVKENALTVRGDISAKEKGKDDQPRQYLHRGIAARAFERRFQLADHVEVKGADLKDGLLHIDLVRNIPERMKARVIPVGVKSAPQTVDAVAPKQIEGGQ